MPAGTTSFYFRTRKALLHAVATRLTELDVADLSSMSELADDEPTQFTGTSGLAHIVMYVATEPWLTRAKARYELLLLGGRDAELAATINRSVEGFYSLARDVVAQWHPAGRDPDLAVLEDQAVAILAFVNGVMMTFVAGKPAVEDAAHLDRLIQGVIAGVAQVCRD